MKENSQKAKKELLGKKILHISSKSRVLKHNRWIKKSTQKYGMGEKEAQKINPNRSLRKKAE